jgi:flagellar protein FliO/FliZ
LPTEVKGAEQGTRSMETIFGTDMPFAAKVLLAVMIVICLAAGAFYMVRRFGGARFGVATLRGRQPRLALIEVAGVDARRSLVLIRRDNVEHLLMIGGPTDVVVEPNIVRAVAVGARETSARSAAEVAPRSSATAEADLWPQQPDSPPRPQRQPASEEPVAWQPPPPPKPQPEPAAARAPHPADPLGALAAELGRTTPQSNKETVPPLREPKRTPQTVPAPQAAAAADPNLSEMAQRLEAALRHAPGARTEPVVGKAAAPEISVGSRVNGSGGPVEPAPARVAASDGKAPRTDVKPGAPKAVYDSLEAEMASLLGRPAAKL